MSDTPKTDELQGYLLHADTYTCWQQTLKLAKRLERENAALRADKERLDWLDGLLKRHEMISCHKGKNNPLGLRRYDCKSEIHLCAGKASVYLRDDLGNVVQSGYGDTLRAAIDAARKSGHGTDFVTKKEGE